MPTPRPSPRRADAQANVERIVAAASALLVADPDVSMAAVADKAGVGRSTLYRHFPQREDLVQAVRRRARDLAETDQAQGLRPPGELANTATTPLSVPDVLNKVSPFQLGEQVVAEARRLDGVAEAALYLIDLQGRLLRKLAGAALFPSELEVGGGVGTEIPREAFEAVRGTVAEVLPGTSVLPLVLRGRALGVLVVKGTGDDALRDLAREAAAALSLADGYTDILQQVRRARPTSPAAEIQQNLLPARITRVHGATLAGNVMPGYEIGGDWFDIVENADATWLGVADVTGHGARTAGLAAVLLGAFRSARRRGDDLEAAVRLMNEVLAEVGTEGVRAAVTIARWNGTTSRVRWVSCGQPGPLLARADGTLEELEPDATPSLGEPGFDGSLVVRERRLVPGDRLVLFSDGGRLSADADDIPFGLDGLAEILRASPGVTAAATVNAIERAICARLPGDLADDVATVVLAPDRQTR